MKFPILLPTIVATTFCAILLVFLLNILNKKRAGILNIKKPPQAKFTLPIIGHLHLLRGPELPYKILGNMADIYGPIFTIKLGFRETLVVSNSEIARNCLTTHDKAFASRPKAKAFELMAQNYAGFGFAPYGDYWRQIRKQVVSNILSQRQVELLNHVRVSEVRESIKEMYDGWIQNKESGNGRQYKVEMKQWFGNITLNIMVKTICGKRFSPNDEEGVQNQSIIRNFFELSGVNVVSDYIPFLEFLDLGNYIKAMKKVSKELDDIMDRWLRELKSEKRESRKQHQGKQVFMNTLMSVLEGASKDDYPGFDHDTIIKVTSQQMLTAGVDTTAATLIWTLSLLLNNPKVLEMAQAEIDEHVGRERLVDEADMKNLVYLEAIIKESMRLYPPGPLSVPHESTEDCVIDGYHIRKGTRILFNLSKIQRDPNIYPDPNEFRPERFLTTHKDIDVKGNHFELLPFSSGRRMCPGIFFALYMIRLTLASLIQQFVLQKPSEEPIDMSETAGMSNIKGTPLDVIISPRLSLDMYEVGAS